MLLIGSRAAKFHFPNFRRPKDYDFIATSKEVDRFLKRFPHKDTSKHINKRRALVEINNSIISFEFDLIEAYPSSNILFKCDKNYEYHDPIFGFSYRIASPETLFLLKKSHIPFNIHWHKNIYDYLFLKSKINQNTLPSWWQGAYDMRAQEVKDRVCNKQMNFDVDNSEFFKKSEKFVNRIVPHDSLHYATCFYDRPLFLLAKENATKAALSEYKLSLMSDSQKIEMIQEECMALALERIIIPSLIKGEQYNTKIAYQTIAAKMVYHYLPFFLRHFAADHFMSISRLDIDYVQKCLNNHPNLSRIISEKKNEAI